MSLIDKAIAALSAVSDRIEDSAQVIENLTEVNLSLTDIAHRVNAQTIELTGDPETMLTKIETRLALIEKLQKKYGTTIKDILEYRSNLQQQLDQISGAQDEIEKLKRSLSAAEGTAMQLAKTLSLKRAGAAKALEEKITAELAYLEMAKVRFKVDISDRQELGPEGFDQVEFLISTNVGEDLAPAFQNCFWR